MSGIGIPEYLLQFRYFYSTGTGTLATSQFINHYSRDLAAYFRSIYFGLLSNRAKSPVTLYSRVQTDKYTRCVVRNAVHIDPPVTCKHYRMCACMRNSANTFL